MKTYIGVDIGGTNVRVAKISHDGIILYEAKGPSYAQEGPEKVMSHLMEMIEEVPNYQECSGIGIGVPGPVDTIKGEMVMSTNLPGFEHYPIAKEIEDRFHLPTFVDNDANVAGLAEALLGAGKGLPVVYYITHSTGIGGALVVGGRVVSGMNGHAGEIGNIIVNRETKIYNHLNAGAVENEASGTAIVRKACERINPNITSAGEVFQLAKEGNEVAEEIIDAMAYDFAVMMASIAHVVDPFCFVIGGGVTKSRALYIEKLKKYFYSMVHEGMRGVEICFAQLEEPGILGAAMLPASFGK